MPSDKLTKVHQLIALATSNTTVEEARTAAHQACKLIEECGFQIVKGDSRTAAPSPPPREPTRERYASTTSGSVDDFYDVWNRTWGYQHPSRTRPPEPPKPPEPPRAPKPPNTPYPYQAPVGARGGPKQEPPPRPTEFDPFFEAIFGKRWRDDPAARKIVDEVLSGDMGSQGSTPDTYPPPRRPVLHKDIDEGHWVWRPYTPREQFFARESQYNYSCDGCKCVIRPADMAWHSRYEIRCIACTAGPVGDSFSKRPR